MIKEIIVFYFLGMIKIKEVQYLLFKIYQKFSESHIDLSGVTNPSIILISSNHMSTYLTNVRAKKSLIPSSYLTNYLHMCKIYQLKNSN